MQYGPTGGQNVLFPRLFCLCEHVIFSHSRKLCGYQLPVTFGEMSLSFGTFHPVTGTSSMTNMTLQHRELVEWTAFGC